MLHHDEVHQGFKHGHFDFLAAGATPPRHQPGQDGGGYIITGGLVRHDRGHEAGLTGGNGLQVRQAGGGLDDVVISGIVGHGSVLAETIGGAKYQIGVSGGKFFVLQAEFFGHFWAHVMHKDIRGANDLEQRIPACLLGQIQHDAALVTIGSQIQRRHALVPARTEISCGIARRGLNLDHVGAHIAQHLRRPGPQNHRGQIDHAYPIQCARHAIQAPLFVPPRPSHCGPVSGAACPASCPPAPPCLAQDSGRTRRSRAARGLFLPGTV